MSEKPISLFSFAIAMTLLAAGCSEKKSQPIKSQEQIEHKKDMDYCFSLMVEAGAKWHQGDQVGDLCKRQNPTPPERARAEIMALLGKKGLAPQNLAYPYELPDGECKRIAERFVALHERAFGQDGDAKEKTLSEAAALMANVNKGTCI